MVDLVPPYVLLSLCILLGTKKLCYQLRLRLKEKDVILLEELFVQEGIIFDPNAVMLDIDSACHDIASQQIAFLVEAMGELTETVQEVCLYSTNQTCTLLLLLSSSLQGGTLCVDGAAHR